MSKLRLSGLSAFGLCLLLSGCAASQDSSAPPPDPDASPDLGQPPDLDSAAKIETVLRVHYPLATGSLSVRGGLAPLSWMSGRSMIKRAGAGETIFELRLRGLTGTLEWKPLIDDSTWSRGSNYSVKPGQTIEVYPHFHTASGHFERHYSSFHSTVLGNDRGVWVYLPPSYDENPYAHYPVVYMHDGQNLFDPAYAFLGRTWKVAATLDAGIDALDAASHLAEMVIIGPENTAQRIYEYTPTPGDDPMLTGGGGDLYLRFLADELKPAIEADARFRGRLLTDRAHTALVGSSLGGLITSYAGLKQPALWGRLGIFSPSSWWDGLFIVKAVAAAAALTPRELRVYVDSGSPNDDTDDTAALTKSYRAIGYRDDVDLKYVVTPGAEHNEDAWAARLPAALGFLGADW